MTIHPTEARRLAIAALGALAVSAACIAGAAAPAWAAGPDTNVRHPARALDHGRPTQRLTFPDFV